MTSPQFSISFHATLSGMGSKGDAGDPVIQDPVSGTFVQATAEARNGGRRTTGITLGSYWPSSAVEIQQFGQVPRWLTKLGPGTSSWVRVSDTGTLERCTPVSGDDIVGNVEADGTLHLCCGILTAEMVAPKVTPPLPLPVLTMLSPPEVEETGGQTVIAIGTHLAGANNVRVGDADVAPISSDEVTCTFVAPPHAPGDVAVSVTTAAGDSNSIVLVYTETLPAPNPPPAILSVSPSLGDTYGSVPLTLTVVGDVSAVTIGGMACTSVVQNDGTVTCISPALPAGMQDVVVSGPDGSSAPLVGGFEAWHPTVDVPTAAVWQSDQVTPTAGRVKSWVAQGAGYGLGGWGAYYRENAFGSLPAVSFEGEDELYRTDSDGSEPTKSGLEFWIVGNTTDARSAANYPSNNPPNTLVTSNPKFGLSNGAIEVFWDMGGGNFLRFPLGGSVNDGQTRMIGFEAWDNHLRAFVGTSPEGVEGFVPYDPATVMVSGIGVGYNGADNAIYRFGAFVLMFEDQPTSPAFRAKLNTWAKKWGSVS